MKFLGYISVILFFLIGLGLAITSQSGGASLYEIASLCLSKGESYTSHCFVRNPDFRQLIGEEGVGHVMRDVSQMYRDHDEIAGFHTSSCHDVAHIVGKVGAELDDDIGRTLSECTQLCNQGCIHGAIFHYMSKTGDTDITGDICQELNTPSLLACHHGLGHVYAFISNLNLEDALQLCDNIAAEEGRYNCGRGVLMELYSLEIGEHELLEEPEDLLMSCSLLRFPYDRSCYANVGSRTFSNTLDVAESLSICAQVPKNHAKTCYWYVGQYMYYYTGGDESMIDECRAHPEAFESCADGYLDAKTYNEN